MVSPKTGPSQGTKFTTPGGTPASLHILKIHQLDNNAVSDGFQSTALPCNRGMHVDTCVSLLARLPLSREPRLKGCQYGLQITNHQCRRIAEITANGSEVEGRYRRDETIHAAIPHRVESLLIWRDRLILEALFHEIRMHLEEVDQLRCTVDLRLDHCLALAEHSGGVKTLPVFGRHQIRYPQPHLQPFLDRPLLPFSLRLHRDVDRFLHELRRRPVILGDFFLVIVRLEKNSQYILSCATKKDEKLFASNTKKESVHDYRIETYHNLISAQIGLDLLISDN